MKYYFSGNTSIYVFITEIIWHNDWQSTIDRLEGLSYWKQKNMVLAVCNRFRSGIWICSGFENSFRLPLRFCKQNEFNDGIWIIKKFHQFIFYVISFASGNGLKLKFLNAFFFNLCELFTQSDKLETSFDLSKLKKSQTAFKTLKIPVHIVFLWIIQGKVGLSF